jgi:hypothetical protein
LLLFHHTSSPIDAISLEVDDMLWTISEGWWGPATRGKISVNKLIKSIGHGLLAAGVFLVVLYFVGVYVKGSDVLRDALDPLASKNYLVLIPLVPGGREMRTTGLLANMQIRLP